MPEDSGNVIYPTWLTTARAKRSQRKRLGEGERGAGFTANFKRYNQFLFQLFG